MEKQVLEAAAAEVAAVCINTMQPVIHSMDLFFLKSVLSQLSEKLKRITKTLE